jgi:tellurite resistance protein
MSKKMKILKHTLLIFVWISIGFAIGRHYTAIKMNNRDNATPSVTEKGRLVRVYYLHATLRCSTCNTIERMTKGLLNDKYAAAIDDGQIEFESIDFQEKTKLAEQFDVVSSCVVVAKVIDGKIVEYQRLDKVWTLLSSPPEFNAYLSEAIDKYLYTSVL